MLRSKLDRIKVLDSNLFLLDCCVLVVYETIHGKEHPVEGVSSGVQGFAVKGCRVIGTRREGMGRVQGSWG